MTTNLLPPKMAIFFPKMAMMQISASFPSMAWTPLLGSTGSNSPSEYFTVKKPKTVIGIGLECDHIQCNTQNPYKICSGYSLGYDVL